jgi:hypothetical protein
MTKLRLKDAWEDYRTLVIPKDAPPVQVRESRRAFYAGAQALLSVIMRQLTPDVEPTEPPTEADLQMMDEIDGELVAFFASVAAGTN